MFSRQIPASLAELQEVSHTSRYYTPQSLIHLVNTQRLKVGKILFVPNSSRIYAWLASLATDRVSFHLSSEVLPHQRIIHQNDPKTLSEFLSIRNEQERIMRRIYETLRTAYIIDEKGLEWKNYPIGKKPDFCEFFWVNNDSSIEENRAYLHIPRSWVRNTISDWNSKEDSLIKLA